MQKVKNYLTLNEWKTDLKRTVTDIKDIVIIAKRTIGVSHYGLSKWGGEMTSKELEDFNWRQSALWFDDKREFETYAMNNYWPLGRCLVGHGKNARKFDDSVLFGDTRKYDNFLDKFEDLTIMNQ